MVEIKLDLSTKAMKIFQEKAEESVSSGTDQYIQHLLEVIAGEMGQEGEKVAEELSEEEKIAQRLRDLGYI